LITSEDILRQKPVGFTYQNLSVRPVLNYFIICSIW